MSIQENILPNFIFVLLITNKECYIHTTYSQIVTFHNVIHEH
jgi:hypothetical protein